MFPLHTLGFSFISTSWTLPKTHACPSSSPHSLSPLFFAIQIFPNTWGDNSGNFKLTHPAPCSVVKCFLRLVALFCFPDGRTPCVNIMTTYRPGPGRPIGSSSFRRAFVQWSNFHILENVFPELSFSLLLSLNFLFSFSFICCCFVNELERKIHITVKKYTNK